MDGLMRLERKQMDRWFGNVQKNRPFHSLSRSRRVRSVLARRKPVSESRALSRVFRSEKSD
jgi:hypothetical protein